ncbi:queuosine precursor transporter [Candidatus Babeliales bacterium]|nr:queuosine precursor transporter [Candidatus Babeliales bacterium]
MNELLFFLHIMIVVFFTLSSLALGRNALVAVVCLQAVLANFFVLKQISLFGLNVTCGNVFVVGSVLGLNLLQEYFGKSITKKTIWISFFLLFFYLVMTQIHLLYIPNSYDNTQSLFSGLLGFMPRITIVSIFGYFVAQKTGYFLYGFLKKMFSENYLVLRNILTISSTQFLDTVLFTFFGLYGIVESVLNVMILSFVIKMVIILVSSPFVSFSKKIVNRFNQDL